jgi:hypothetical protein
LTPFQATVAFQCSPLGLGQTVDAGGLDLVEDPIDFGFLLDQFLLGVM